MQTAPATKEPAATKPPQATKSDPNRKASMLRELRAKTAQMTTFKRRLYDADVNLLKVSCGTFMVAQGMAASVLLQGNWPSRK